MDFDLENPLTHLHQLHSDDASLFLTESDHMLSPSYLHTLLTSPSDFAVRRDTIYFISQVPIFSFSFFFLQYFPLTLFPPLQCCSNSNIDPHLSYLAVNYLDRFFSFQGMPVIPFTLFFFFPFPSLFFLQYLFSFFSVVLQQPKPWVLRLLAVSCVSLAAKMKQIEHNLSDFQVLLHFPFCLVS